MSQLEDALAACRVSTEGKYPLPPAAYEVIRAELKKRADAFKYQVECETKERIKFIEEREALKALLRDIRRNSPCAHIGKWGERIEELLGEYDLCATSNESTR